MRYQAKRENVDHLVKNFWKFGYLTLSRKYGTYLPEPKPVGIYDVDAIGKYKRKYVIGITLTDEEIEDPRTISKLQFLATRNSKYTKKNVNLFVGVSAKNKAKVKRIVSRLSEDARKNIKLLTIN